MIHQETVLEWLQEQRIKEYDTDLEVVPVGFTWALTFRPESRFLVFTGQRAVDWNDVAMQISVNVSPEHLEGLQGLDPELRERFWFDLRIALLQKPIGYSLDFSEEEEPLLRGITVGYNLLEAPLTKAGFFRRHHQLQSAMTLAVQMLKRTIRFPEQ